MDLAGKVALVTGAGSGIGRATALRLAHEGAAVAVDDIDAAAGQETVRLIENDPSTGSGRSTRAAFVRADVAVEDDVRRMIAFAEETFGGLDVLVNNAGCAFSAPYFPEGEVAAWSHVLDVYLRGVMLGIHYGMRAMGRRGGGGIVNIASGAGMGFRPHDLPEYAAAKAGVVRLTASLAPLRERMNVRVNCICPGWVDTPASRRTIAAMSEEERRAQVPPVLRTPEEIADAVVQLVRDETLAGRVMLYYEGEERRLVPANADV